MNRQMNIDAEASLRITQSGDLPLLHIDHPRAHAIVALQGAQVLHYQLRAADGQRQGSRPLIWLSDQVAYQRGQSLRGGVPVCWPWFGDLIRNPEPVRKQFSLAQAPAHGLVRGENWLLEKFDRNNDATRVTLRYPATDLLAGINLRLEISVGATLQMVLRTTNSSDRSFTFSQALHTYFAIGDIHRTEVRGLETSPYIETLKNWAEKKQNGPIVFNGETDRIYLHTPESIQIHDPVWQREIHLRSTGSKSAVIWNPWIEKSKRLSQFAPDAWQQMLCVETANVMHDCVNLLPGQNHALSLTISEKSLADG
jgi:glucose-6-phosphate 1-epimerase